MQQQTGKIFTNDYCVGCNLCITNCPCLEANVAVMEDSGNKIYIDPEKCILCGECVRNCSHHARDYLDDTQLFFEHLSQGQQIPLLVAPAVRTNFPEYGRLLGYLRSLGVSYIFDTSFGADICTWAYLRYIAREQATGVIAQPCPAIVNYVERYAPDLLGNLAPVHSPAMCLAVYMKHYKNIPGSYAFLSPCISKRDEFQDPNTGSLVGYNITFHKLQAYLEQQGVDYRKYPADHYDNEQHGLGLLYPMPGGLRQNIEQHLNDTWIYQVEGQPHACHFLQEYRTQMHGEAPLLIDILNCQHGCNVGTGALCDDTQTLHVGRALHQAKLEARQTMRRKQKTPGPDFKKFDKELALDDFKRTYSRDKVVRERKVSSQELETAFQKLRKYSDLQRDIDCRSCGFSSCRKMAEAVAKGINHVENCVEYFKSVLRKQKEQMEAIAEQREQQSQELRMGMESIFAAISQAAEQTAATVEGVESINEQITLMNDISNRLSEHVTALRREIDKFTKMSDQIVDISSQTNLLALNASIEAARAGQYGKGFAVVAEQIKRLSDQSQQSARSASQNNEVVAPLLRQVNDVSAEVLQESQVIADHAAAILQAITMLSQLQRDIANSASMMADSDTGAQPGQAKPWPALAGGAPLGLDQPAHASTGGYEASSVGFLTELSEY